MATVEQTMINVQRLLTGPMGLNLRLENCVISIVFSDLSTSVQVRIHDWVKDNVARTGGSRWFGHVEVAVAQ